MLQLFLLETLSTKLVKSGIRYVPMTDEVSACFKQIIENRKKCNNETVIDGKQGFLFLSKNGIPLDARVWEGCFSRICKKYNEVHEKPIPKVTPHVCRHTFCSRMVKKGMNPKALQYIMGHSDIGVTLNTYTHLGLEDATDELRRMEELENNRKELEKNKEEKSVSQKMF